MVEVVELRGEGEREVVAGVVVHHLQHSAVVQAVKRGGLSTDRIADQQLVAGPVGKVTNF